MSELKDPTVYSPIIKGSHGNWNWNVRFDRTSPGYIGISQFHETEVERVLLSPKQAEALVKFIQRNKRAHVKRPSKKRAK